MLSPPRNKLGKFLNYRVKVTTTDHRYYIGQLLTFDSHSNIVLKNCDEYRKNEKRKTGQPLEIKRNLGMMLLRGDNVMQIAVIGKSPEPIPKPPGFDSSKVPQTSKQRGNAKITMSKPAKPVLPSNSLPQ